MANSIITYFMPYLMAADVIGNSSPARNHPESARPRTLTLDPAILSLKASLSRLRITPTPPALKHEKPNIKVYMTRILFCNMCAKFKLVKNLAKPIFLSSLKQANLPAPALKHEKPNIKVYMTRILFCNMCAKFKLVKNLAKPIFFSSLKQANLPLN